MGGVIGHGDYDKLFGRRDRGMLTDEKLRGVERRSRCQDAAGRQGSDTCREVAAAEFLESAGII